MDTPGDVFAKETVRLDVGAGVSRRSVLTHLSALGALVGTTGTAGCLGNDAQQGSPDASETSTNTRDTTETAPESDEYVSQTRRVPAVAPPDWDPAKTERGAGSTDRTAVFVIDGIDNSFWNPLTCGFHDALTRFGWRGRVTGAPILEGGPNAQMELLNDEIDALGRGDVLVTMIPEHLSKPGGWNELRDVLQRGLDKGVVVVNATKTPRTEEWHDASLEEPFSYRDTETIVPYVGVNQAHGGAALAGEAYDRLQTKIPDAEEYTVLLTNELSDKAWATRRISKEATDEGTAQRYFETKDDVTVYGSEVITPPPNTDQARTEIANEIEGEGVDAVVCSAFWGAVGAGRALDAGELEGPMVICGFDVVKPLLEAIQNGLVDFTVGQDLYGQGYRSATMAWTYLERGISMRDLEWGVSVWDQHSVTFGLERHSWDQLYQWQQANYEHLQ